jgi:hypothetical protein
VRNQLPPCFVLVSSYLRLYLVVLFVFISYCYSAASPVATERRAPCQINFLDNDLAVIELRPPLSTSYGL